MTHRGTFVSLFAGVGGFDLAMERAGYACAGQCEIDPHARAVLERHWPDTPRHDDVQTLTASTFAHPDVVTFGSPCQDLSVAGARAGMVDGTRSGLFMDAVRYIREVQEASGGRYPRFAVWENVPGAFSSNNGADFTTVLTLLVGGNVRRPTGGWSNAGVAFGPLGSAEWRVLDSRYFGVAQRRRRVFLVYRPGSDSAGEVLLEPDGVPRDSQESEPAREDVAGTLEARTRGGGFPGTDGAVSGHVVPALSGGHGGGAGHQYRQKGNEEAVVPVWKRRGGHGWSGREDGVTPTLDTGQSHGVAAPVTARDAKGPPTDATGMVPVAFKVRGGVEVDSAGKSAGKGYLGSEDIALTISTVQEQHLAVPTAYAARDYSTGRYEQADVAEAITTSADRTRAAPIALALRGREDGAIPEVSGDQANALRGSEGGSSRDYVAFDLAQITSPHNRTRAEPGLPNGTLTADSNPHVAIAPTLTAANNPSRSPQSSEVTQQVEAVHAASYAVRRLTPRECERLQGFPDDWTITGTYDGHPKTVSDTHRYRMMGNAVTVNVVEWIARRLPFPTRPREARQRPW